MVDTRIGGIRQGWVVACKKMTYGVGAGGHTGIAVSAPQQVALYQLGDF